MARKIFSISSNKAMNYLLKTVMSDVYSVIAVQDAFQAMSVLKAKDIKCILIDIDYQTEQNLAFIQHLKNSFLYQCSIIVLTSKKELDERIMKPNVYDLFVKPFNPIELKRSIGEIETTVLS